MAYKIKKTSQCWLSVVVRTPSVWGQVVNCNKFMEFFYHKRCAHLWTSGAWHFGWSLFRPPMTDIFSLDRCARCIYQVIYQIYQVLEFLCISRELDCCIHFGNIPKFMVTVVAALHVVLTMVLPSSNWKAETWKSKEFPTTENKAGLPEGGEAGAVQHRELMIRSVTPYAVSTETFCWTDRQELDRNISAFQGFWARGSLCRGWDRSLEPLESLAVNVSHLF